MNNDDLPCLLKRIWICFILKRKQAKVAMAASTLASHAFKTGDDKLYDLMFPLQEKLWEELYK